jgi:hypothetical protein
VRKDALSLTVLIVAVFAGTGTVHGQGIPAPWARDAGSRSPSGTERAPAPVQRPERTGEDVAPAAGTSRVPPPPPGAPRESVARASTRVAFVSDDTPVDVFLVVGTREVTELVAVPTASPLVSGAGMGLGPTPWPMTLVGPPFGGASFDPGMTPYGTELVPVRTAVDQREFVCRTPCAAELPTGARRVFLRTAGASLGTEEIAVSPGARFRVRPSAMGLYAVGHVSLWAGVGTLLAGGATLVQASRTCGASPCSLLGGAVATTLGALGVAVGVPLVVFNLRRIEPLRASGPTIALGPWGAIVRW